MPPYQVPPSYVCIHQMQGGYTRGRPLDDCHDLAGAPPGVGEVIVPRLDYLGRKKCHPLPCFSSIYPQAAHHLLGRIPSTSPASQARSRRSALSSRNASTFRTMKTFLQQIIALCR